MVGKCWIRSGSHGVLGQVTSAESIAVENAELEAWRDMYRAMPSVFRDRINPELIELGSVTLTRCKAIPFVHFNAVKNLGMGAPATDAMLDAAIAAYQQAGIPKMVVYHHPLAQPAGLGDRLKAAGFVEKPGWDRVYRFGKPSSIPIPPSRGHVSFVTKGTAASWAAFLDGMYGLPTGPWLLELVGRPGWVHASLERAGRIVAVRSMFLQPGRTAWFGVEAPIPGLMAPSFEDDHCLLHALIGEAERQGVETFAGDIEAPNAEQAGPPYERWTALGFSIGYHRAHFVKAIV